MNDDFLNRLRETPRPAFAETLKHRLDTLEDEELRSVQTHRFVSRWRPVLVGAAFVVVGAVALSVPAVRAQARNFLELFRIKRFAAVPVDMQRVNKLQAQGLDIKTLVSDQVEFLEQPGEPQVVADVREAESITGFPVLQPRQLPRDVTLAETRVAGAASFRATIDTSKIDQVAQALGVTDLEIPHEVNGARVDVKTHPAVVLRYTRGKDSFLLSQSQSPEIALPQGVDLARLGAIGLQLGGMSASEAQLFARKIDWRTTVLVPVPAMGGDFREVEVGDAQGLLVTVRPPQREGGPRAGWQSVLLWSKGDRVFALHGPGRGVELLEMADSIG
jgi:hypothetical protein